MAPLNSTEIRINDYNAILVLDFVHLILYTSFYEKRITYMHVFRLIYSIVLTPICLAIIVCSICLFWVSIYINFVTIPHRKAGILDLIK